MAQTRPLSRLAFLLACKTNIAQSAESCSRVPGISRCLSTTVCRHSESPNKDYVVSKVYRNRNPRNLERLALARKRLGWQFQAPRKDYYHKLVVTQSLRHTEAWVEHSSGEIVVSATTKEWAIRNQLYSCTDVAASHIIGQVLAQRCLESGLTSVFYDDADFDPASERTVSFLQAFKDACIPLTEPEMIKPVFKPGINYDGYHRYKERKVWKEDYQKV